MSNELQEGERQESERQDGSGTTSGEASPETVQQVKLLCQGNLRRRDRETIRSLANTDPEGVLSALRVQSQSDLMPRSLHLLMGQLQLAKAREIESLDDYIKLAYEHLSQFPEDISSLRSFFRNDFVCQTEGQAKAIASILSMLSPTLTVLSYRTLWASLWLPQRAPEAASRLREKIAAARQRYLAPVLQQDKGFAELIASIALARNIAIVGSGPSLRGAGQGAKIDAHDLVVRINLSPAGEPFAEDVGSRADVSFTWAAPANPRFMRTNPSHNNHSYQGALIVQASPAFQKNYTPFTVDDLATAGWSRFTRVPPTIMELVTDLSYPTTTTGFTALVFIALLLDRPVSIFGFDFFQPGRAHFYGRRGISIPAEQRRAQHQTQFEKRMVENMLQIHFGVV